MAHVLLRASPERVTMKTGQEATESKPALAQGAVEPCPVVAEIMTTHVETCAVGDTLDRAAQIMWNHDCGIVPILDKDNRVVAVVTDRDVCMAAYTQGKPLWQLPVTVAASRSVYTLRPNDSIGVAHALMRKQQVRRLPVVDDAGTLLGIVSIADVVRNSAGAAPALNAEDVALTLDLVSQPPHRTVVGSRP